MALKRRNKVSAEFSMSSLTDIIFLLLIFFMLTSSTFNINPKNLDLPESGRKVIVPVDLAVSITKDGQFFIGERGIRSDDLRNQIRIMQAKGESNQHTITIVSEKGTPFKHIAQVMAVAKSMGMNAIIATQPVK